MRPTLLASWILILVANILESIFAYCVVCPIKEEVALIDLSDLAFRKFPFFSDDERWLSLTIEDISCISD